MYKDYDNYRTYENDDLSAGATLKVEHTIIVNETDILNLISQPLEKIQAMRDNNVKKDYNMFFYKYYSHFCNHTFDLSDVSGAEYHDFCDLLSDSQCETARILQRDERNRSLRIGNKQCADFIFSFLIWSSKLDFTVGNIIVTSINT